MAEVLDPVAHVFGANLKRLRQRTGLSQIEFAEKTGISQTYLSAMERGQKFPSGPTIESIAQALGVPYHLLFLSARGARGRTYDYADPFIDDLQAAVLDVTGKWFPERQR